MTATAAPPAPRYLDDLSGHETELLVVVQHRVHVLDPDGVHRTVEQNPLAVGAHRLGELAETVGQYAWWRCKRAAREVVLC